MASPWSPSAPGRAVGRPRHAFHEAAVRELTRLHEARESPWWVEAIGAPVSVAGGFEIVDVVLRCAGAAMALQCLRMHPRPTFRFHRRTAGRLPAGNLFTAACEVLHAARVEEETRGCPALLDAAGRALRGAGGLARPAPQADGAARPSEAPVQTLPAVLTMAHLTVEAPPRAAAPHDQGPGRGTTRERLWVWLLTEASAAFRQPDRQPVAIVTWTGLPHFLGVASAAGRRGPAPDRVTASSTSSLAHAGRWPGHRSPEWDMSGAPDDVDRR